MQIPCPMLTPLLSFVEGSGIGDVNRARSLARGYETAGSRESSGVRLYGVVDRVAVESKHNGRVLCRLRQRGATTNAPSTLR